MEKLICSRCNAVRDTKDNFCRSCGHQFTLNLPAVRSVSLPARRSAMPPALLGSVAVLAVGTGIEWLARRMAGPAAKAAGRALVGAGRPQPPSTTSPAPSQPDSVTVDEVLYVRKVQLRR